VVGNPGASFPVQAEGEEKGRPARGVRLRVTSRTVEVGRKSATKKGNPNSFEKMDSCAGGGEVFFMLESQGQKKLEQ